MKTDSLVKHLFLVFCGALGLYVLSFAVIQHLREAKGPWEVVFLSGASGEPSIEITQQTLGISNVSLVFIDQQISRTNLTEKVVFDSPVTNVTFGKVIFIDTTFLPGTVTFDLFGHEIELFPRVLGVNREPVEWKSGMTVRLSRDQRLRKPERKGASSSEAGSEVRP